MSNKNWVSIKDRPHYFSRNGKVMYKHSFVNPEGKSQQLYAPTKKEWELKKLEIEKNYKIVAGLDKDYSKATFQDMYQLWLEDAETYKVATLTRKKEFMNGKILPTFKDTVVSKVTAHQIENFYKAIEKNHTLKQVEETHRVLNQFFNFLINRQKCISVNPIPKHLIDGYKRRINNIKKEEQILEKATSLEDSIAIMKAVEGTTDEIVYHWAMYHGCRPSEALGVDWSNVDLERGVVQIRQQIIKVSAKQVAGTSYEGKENEKIQSLKTPESRREIPLNSRTKTLLLQTPAEERKGLVFVNTQGNPCNADNFNKTHFQPLIEKLGLKESVPTFYTLRKFFATHHARVFKTDPYTLKDLMGHKDMKTTLSFYVGRIENVVVQEINILDTATDENTVTVKTPTAPTGYPPAIPNKQTGFVDPAQVPNPNVVIKVHPQGVSFETAG